jgi:transposase-like protein
VSEAAPDEGGRQPIAYCPYCSEETLFPREGGGWECHSCLRAFSVSFLGLVNLNGGDRQ